MKIRTTGWMTGILAGMMVLTGCMKINAPKTVKVGDKKTDRPEKIGKADATRIAEGVARDEGQNPKNFNIAEEKTSDGWWVLFDHKLTGYKLGWPYHFAVFVTTDGKSTLYKNH
ncbi:MAG: hypothetical protein JXA11_09125 [Phycisphaerae bacterium]|nr:hypothetical protein [Phycisphaerae bacterium]